LLDKFLTTWLCANSIFGHPNSFAILTTGEKMWIAWMNIGNSNRITDKQNHLSNTELNQLMSRLPCKSVDDKTKTPSFPKLCDEEIADPVGLTKFISIVEVDMNVVGSII
jgi:hypothetical protein